MKMMKMNLGVCHKIVYSQNCLIKSSLTAYKYKTSAIKPKCAKPSDQSDYSVHAHEINLSV